MSIGDLARATGVAVGTLRMWESRHGFPRSSRTGSGHRRYAAAQVAQVLDVARRRDAGVRLDVAVAAVVEAASSTADAGSLSVHAAVSRDHPDQPRQRLRKWTLLGLTWACEDEIAATAARGHLFGSFQTAGNFEAAHDRWVELARTSHGALALADFPDDPDDGSVSSSGPSMIERVSLGMGAPMRREWTVVYDSPDLPVAVTAWELPGQDECPDRDRMFEAIWTLDPRAVRTAARTCAAVAAAAGSTHAEALKLGPLAEPAAPPPGPLTVSRLTHRVLAYVEAAARR